MSIAAQADMCTPEQYVHDRLVGWMAAREPAALASLKSGGLEATAAAVLAWMAENRADDLSLIYQVEMECAEFPGALATPHIGALIMAIETVQPPYALDYSSFERVDRA